MALPPKLTAAGVTAADYEMPGLLSWTRPPVPDVPVNFRGGSTFWFGEPQPAYGMPIPDMGPNHEVVHYEANRLDAEVRFTMDACKQLSAIPNAFIQQVLQGIVKEAKARGVSNVDEAFVIALNKERE